MRLGWLNSGKASHLHQPSSPHPTADTLVRTASSIFASQNDAAPDDCNAKQEQHMQIELGSNLDATGGGKGPGGRLRKDNSTVAKLTRKQVCGLPAALVAGTAYCLASAVMTLSNKAALAGHAGRAPTLLLFFQTFVCALLVLTSHLLLGTELEPLSLKMVRVWLPVNLLYVGMTWTSIVSLRLIGIPMATVLKNITNLFLICGDMLFFGRRFGWRLWASLLLMIASAVAGGFTDLRFDARAYAWQLANCALAAAYLLYLSVAMQRASLVTRGNRRLGEHSMVFYNNVLSLPLLVLVLWQQGELETMLALLSSGRQREGLMVLLVGNARFTAVVFVSGITSFLINFASVWFLSVTAPTIYGLVGALNKLPVAFIGFLAFSDSTRTVQNAVSVAVGLLAGVLFVTAKKG